MTNNEEKKRRPRSVAHIANPGGRPKKPIPETSEIRVENRLEALEDLRDRLARAIDLAATSSASVRVMPGLSREFRAALDEIATLKGEKGQTTAPTPLDELRRRREARGAV